MHYLAERLNSPNIRAGSSVSPFNIWEETYKVDVLFGNKKIDPPVF